MISLLEAHSYFIHNNIPFASFRLPAEKEITTIVASEPEGVAITNNTEFIFIPFVNEVNLNKLSIKGCLYKGFELPDSIQKITGRVYKQNSRAQNNYRSTSELEYVQTVKRAKELIQIGKLQKIVLSKITVINDKQNKQVTNLFERIVKNYPNCFTYIFFHPLCGLWLSATPELFIKVRSNYFETMAMAATKVWDRNSRWSKKEINEHKIVLDYVYNFLKRQNYPNIKVEKEHVARVGNLIHLKACFVVDSVAPDLNFFLQELHPTPSVCGFPTENALKALQVLEKHQRKYYSGLVGFINKEKVDIYVNLRCMEVAQQGYCLYSGAGITEDSTPDLEWKETMLKEQAMRNILTN